MRDIIVLLILITATTKLYSEELNNNFYFNLSNNYLISIDRFADNKESGYSYGLGYLRKINNFYMGVSLKKISEKNIKTYIDGNNLNIESDIDMLKRSTAEVSLQGKYTVFDFENVKILLGLDIGYQINNLSLSYKAYRYIKEKEHTKIELKIGTIIDKDLNNSCNAGIIGDNISYNVTDGVYTVSGESVYCHSYKEVDKEVEYQQNTTIMKSIIPISINLLILYGISNNIDLGIGAGLTLQEKLNVNYSNKFVNVKGSQSYSYYNVQILVNFKL